MEQQRGGTSGAASDGMSGGSGRGRFFDDIAGVAGGAFSALTGLRNEVEAAVRSQVEVVIQRLELVRREELDAALELARRAREEADSLGARVSALEARLPAAPETYRTEAHKPDAPTPTPSPSVPTGTGGETVDESGGVVPAPGGSAPTASPDTGPFGAGPGGAATGVTQGTHTGGPGGAATGASQGVHTGGPGGSATGVSKAAVAAERAAGNGPGGGTSEAEAGVGSSAPLVRSDRT